VSARVFAWGLRLTWATLAFTTGPALSAALQHHGGVRTAASAALWTAWAAVLVATLVAHPVSLTLIRVAAPAAVAASLAAAGEGHSSVVALGLALAWSGATAAVAFLPRTAMICVNGPAYPNERRFPLATPGALLLGPIEVAWTAIVGLPAAAVLWLAARQWVWGGLATVAGIAAVAVGGRALHGLARRWIVFVPAGLVLHDPLSLVDPVLFGRRVVERLRPAPAGSDSLDLTQHAAGLALELILTEKVPMVVVIPGNRRGETGASARLLFTPSRPGAVLAEARSRRFPVG
jgi:hypothetical protein